MKNGDYQYIIVESFCPVDTAGRHGLVHIRPLPNQEPFNQDMFVACSRSLSSDYPVGTQFKIKAKLTDRDGGTPYIYSHYSWEFKVAN